MAQLEKINPIATEVSNHRVIVSDKVFSELIEAVNKSIDVINILIDKHNEDHQAIESLDVQLKDLANSLKNLI